MTTFQQLPQGPVSNVHSPDGDTPFPPYNFKERRLPLYSNLQYGANQQYSTIVPTELSSQDYNSSLKAQAPLQTSSSSSSSPPRTPHVIRRTGNFYAPQSDTSQARSQQDSDTTSSKMMRPSYSYQPEMPSYNEWTQRFEQINLQAPQRASPMLSLQPSRSEPFVQSSAQAPFQGNYGHTKTLNEHSSPSHRTPMPQIHSTGHRAPRYIAPDPQEHIPVHVNANLGAYAASIDEHTKTLRRTKQFYYGYTQPHVVNCDPTVQSQINPHWLQSLPGSTDGYGDSGVGSQPTQGVVYAHPDALGQYDPYGAFVTPNHASYYSAAPMAQPQQMNSQEHRSDFYAADEEDNVGGMARVPTLSSGPSSLSSPPQTPPEANRRSKANHRRVVKSVGNLKPAKSSSSLKHSKSAGALKSARSSGTLKPHGQSPPSIYGFMNFTPEDSAKILTGVAPSGSSKTKARREMEANERRKGL